MQTFLPHKSFTDTMACLDSLRLGNQVYREGKTLIGGGWPNHPASKMWQGHFHHLALYCIAGLIELQARGRNYPKWFEFFEDQLSTHPETGPPSWMLDERLPLVTSSHRANLLRKNPEWYGQFGWTEIPTEGYYWPC